MNWRVALIAVAAVAAVALSGVAAPGRNSERSPAGGRSGPRHSNPDTLRPNNGSSSSSRAPTACSTPSCEQYPFPRRCTSASTP